MNQWKERERPNRLERRYEFQNYDETRDFLDKLGKLCEERNRFPDISFGKTYVNLTLKPESDDLNEKPTEADKKFTSEIDVLAN